MLLLVQPSSSSQLLPKQHSSSSINTPARAPRLTSSQKLQALSLPVHSRNGSQLSSSPSVSRRFLQRHAKLSSFQVFRSKPEVFHSSSMDLKGRPFYGIFSFSYGPVLWFSSGKVSHASEGIHANMVYETGELFELGIQLTYLLLLVALLGAGSFFVIRQVLIRRELDLSAKELQEQVRSGGANGTELFELGAVMLRRKLYPTATRYLLQAIEKWDGDRQDLSQVYNALGVSYVRAEKIDKGIAEFETAVKLQPGYVTAWNNLGDAYEKNKDLEKALRAFEEVLLLDPNNRVARPRRDALKDKVTMFKGVPVISKKR